MKKLFKLVLLVGGVALVAKAVTAKKAEWEGLTEPEVRAKLEAKLPDKVPAEKRAEVADRVVAKMRDRGKLRDEAVAGSNGDGPGMAEAGAEAGEDPAG